MSSYKRTVLFAQPEFEIVSCEWKRSDISAMHSHGWSQCLVLIEQGEFENTADFALKTEIETLQAGQVIATPLGVEHEIRCLSDSGRTLHVYVPRIAKESKGHVFSADTLAHLREKMDLRLTDQPMHWQQVNSVLEQIREKSISTDSPMFMNQLFSGIFPETIAAEAVLSQTRTTLATYEASPSLTAVEIEVVEALGRLIGWNDSETDGIGVPGGSAANMMAIHCARQKAVPEFRRRGSSGERFKVFTSQQSHYSMKKSCIALGIGTDALVEVATGRDGKMLTESLREEIQRARGQGAIPLLVCATAGTTVLGAFDPISEIADICAAEKVWLHVDGAWGAPALFSKTARNLMYGIARADSLTFDAHKLLGSNLTSSFFVNRHRGLLLQANDVSGADYLFHDESKRGEVVQDRGRMSWQCGRGGEALSFWTLWKNHGTAGIGDFVDRLFAIREETLAWIRTQKRLTLVAEPEYLNICVRVGSPNGLDPDWSRKVREQLKLDQTAFVNYSTDQDGTFLRLILAHPRLKTENLVDILSRALEIH